MKSTLLIVIGLLVLLAAFAIIGVLISIFGPRTSLLKNKLRLGTAIIGLNALLLGCESEFLSESALRAQSVDSEGELGSDMPGDTGTEAVDTETNAGDGMDSGVDSGIDTDTEWDETCYDPTDPKPESGCDCQLAGAEARKPTLYRIASFFTGKVGSI